MIASSDIKTTYNHKTSDSAALKQKVSKKVIELVDKVGQSRLDSKKPNVFYQKNLNSIYSLLSDEVNSYSWIIRRSFLGKKALVHHKVIKALISKIDKIRYSEKQDEYEQVVLIAAAMDLLENKWSASDMVPIARFNSEFISQLEKINDSEQLLQLYINERLQYVISEYAGVRKDSLHKLLKLNRGWMLVPTELSLSVEDLLYLNLNQIAPLWISKKKQIVDGVSLSPLRLYLHDLNHYRQQSISKSRDRWGGDFSAERLETIRRIILDLTADNADIVATTAAFLVSHEIMDKDSVDDFILKRSYYKYRFENDDDFGLLFKKYNSETGRDLDSFMWAMGDILARKINSEQLSGLADN